ncbi:MAG: hypothetical protein JWN17_1411 [Frankiales bacterium]|nr:hypothetical protein [Frankiales bacterium]
MRSTRLFAAVGAAALLAAVPLAAAGAATPTQALATTSGYGGYSTGSVVYANALNAAGDPDITKTSLAQSAAAASIGEPLVTQDLLSSSILTAAATGKNAYGHGSAVNEGLLQGQTAPPQVALTTAEALSPPPTAKATTNELLTLPADPVAQAQLLPSSAQARTTSLDSICVTGTPAVISTGTGQATNARLLTPAAGQSVATVDGAVRSLSSMLLTAPSGGATGSGLTSVTNQSLAPLTLFKGIPGAETTITVLHQLQLSATAGGTAGSGKAFYGFVDSTGKPVANSEPVLMINGQGLTSEQVLGGDGVQLSLGVADVFIGAPNHGLDDDPASAPRVDANGTTVGTAADLVRIKVPGTVTTGSTTPVATDSPLAPVLNPVLQPVVAGLSPVLSAVQAGLVSAGLGVADLRYGHLEALATVPAGGIVCGDAKNPLDESRKDVSTLSVRPGQTFEYTVRFPNRGTDPITDVVVTDTYAAGLEFVSSDPTPTSRSGSTLTYRLGTIAPGAFADVSLTFRVPADAKAGTVYRNDARITGTYLGRTVTKDVSVPGPTVIGPLTGACDVSRSTKYASNTQVTTGEQFAYYVNVSNTGGSPCTGVTVKDTLDDGVAFVSCSDACTHSGQDVTWRVGTLAPGASRTLSVVVRTTATSGRLPNTAVIGTTEGSTASPSTPGPVVTTVSTPAPGKPAGCPTTGCPGGAGQPGAEPAPEQLPRTGGSGLLAGGALLLTGAAFGIRKALRA